jgi:hypothetical protein
MLSSNLSKVADGRVRWIGNEPEPIPGRSGRAGSCRRGPRRRDHFDRGAILEILSAECIDTVFVGSSEGRAPPFHPKRVDDGVHLSHRVTGIQGVGDCERVEEEHVLQVQRRFFFPQIELNAAFGDLSGPHDVALADTWIVRMRAQRARSRGRRIWPQ